MGSSLIDGLCDGHSNKRPLENGFYTSSDILCAHKKQKISSVRDFPSGCGWNAPHINLAPQDTGAVATLGDNENLVADINMLKGEVRSLVKNEKGTESKTVLENGSMANGIDPSSVGKENEATELSKDYEVEVQAVVKAEDGSESKTVLEIDSMANGICPYIVTKANDATELSKDYEVEVKAVVKGEVRPERNTLLEIGSMANGVVPSGGAKAWSPPQWPISDANISKETALENKYPRRRVSATREFPSFCGRNAPSLTEEERLIVVLGNKTLVSSAEVPVQGVLKRETMRAKEEKDYGESLKRRPKGNVALGHEFDSVIVQGLKAAENCPWKHRDGAVRTVPDRVMIGNDSRRHDVSHIIGKRKSEFVNRTRVYEADYLGGKSMKKLLPSKKVSCESKGAKFVKDEGDLAAGLTPRDFEVSLPRFGPSRLGPGNMRNKVRETLRLFQAICRKLLQGEEAKLWHQGYMSRRIDLQATQIIRAKGKEVNTDKQIIGAVPGVEVGDEFQYRVELALVGVHRLYQAGIDYMKHGGMIIATSIVASGGYADDLDNPDVLIYSGHGGNIVGKDKQPEDQKLVRGNLALKNSISAKNPVRVIHGTKETKAPASDGRAKIVLTYTYDGLYIVERYWHDVGPHGQLVFKFELKRIPGQPEIPWKEVKKSRKFKIREGLCINDIAGERELFPICAVNTMDKGKPPKFNYITKMKYPDRYRPDPPKGCDCIDGCLDSQKCSCVVKNGGEIPYNHNGAIVEVKPLVYECGPSCKCPPSCYNRVSQHGIKKIQLEIFKTKSRGWGVRSLTSIPSGSFICEYIGELLEDKEAEKRHNDEYLFDIGQNCSLIDGISTLKPDAQLNSSEVLADGGFTIDAARCGNVGRFINHSCSPNLYAQNVLYDHEDKRMPHIMLFAAENIPPLKELTYNYNYAVDQVLDSNGNIKVKSCYCGSAECTGRMY